MRVLLILVALVAACGGDDGYDTVRDATIAVAEAFCDRLLECAGGSEDVRIECEANFTASFCANENCSAPFTGDEGDVDACIDALDDHSCTADALPAQCLGVIQ